MLPKQISICYGGFQQAMLHDRTLSISIKQMKDLLRDHELVMSSDIYNKHICKSTVGRPNVVHEMSQLRAYPS